jgi:GxxExxY protein
MRRRIAGMKTDLNHKDTKGTKIWTVDEGEEIADPWSRLVIGAAIAVHRTLGPDFLESVYEEALCIELQEREIPFAQQAPVAVRYRSRVVGEGLIDVLVGGTLVVELKAVDAFAPIHIAQVLSYLRAIEQPLGLLLNFKVANLGKDGLKRVIHT